METNDIPRASKIIAYGCLVLVLIIGAVSVGIIAYGLWIGG